MSVIDYSALAKELGRVRLPRNPGDSLTGTVVSLLPESNPFSEGGKRARLYLEEAPGGIPVNNPLLDVLASMNIQPGEKITITRGEPMPSVNGRPGRSTWTVDRHTAPVSPNHPAAIGKAKREAAPGPAW